MDHSSSKTSVNITVHSWDMSRLPWIEQQQLDWLTRLQDQLLTVPITQQSNRREHCTGNQTRTCKIYICPLWYNLTIDMLIIWSRELGSHRHSHISAADTQWTMTAPLQAITAPEWAITAPQWAITAPLWAITAPQWAVTASQWATTAPECAITATQWVITPPQRVMTAPQRAITAPQWTITAPQQAITAPQWAITAPEWAITASLRAITAPQWAVTAPEWAMKPRWCSMGQ